MEETQKRQVAQKVRIVELLEGRYVKEEGWQPNYIISSRGEKVSRANIIATVVMVEPGSPSASLMIDDGSGTISIRSFENNPLLRMFEVGSIINIIGRPREYNTEKYLVPEIIRDIKDRKWFEIRNKELSLRDENKVISPRDEPEERITPQIESGPRDIKVEEIDVKEAKIGRTQISQEANASETQKKNSFQAIYEVIRRLDSGDGADINEIIEKAGISNAEEILKQLTREGEIFEIRRGRIKVLE